MVEDMREQRAEEAPGQANVAIIGSGNIGTDLMYKLVRSPALTAVAMVGIDPASDGLKRAREMGLWATSAGLDAFLGSDVAAEVSIVFDATSAGAHRAHASALSNAGKIALDLTPAAVGALVVPAVEIPALDSDSTNLNFVSCGGQATVPIVHAVGQGQMHPVRYAEIVSTTASRSVGPGTRANLDDYIHTTSSALRAIGGAVRSKTLTIVSPATPPIMMRNTVYCLVEPGHEDEILESVNVMIGRIQQYVPGYRMLFPPQFEQLPHQDGVKAMIVTEVEGAGDYLEPYAGNLDIITSAAVEVAERLATSPGTATNADVGVGR
jgi:acetaldehyde dehydrogenase